MTIPSELNVDLEKTHKDHTNSAAYQCAQHKYFYGYHHTFDCIFVGVLGGIPLTSEFGRPNSVLAATQDTSLVL